MKLADEIGIIYCGHEENIEIMAKKILAGINKTGNRAILTNVVNFDMEDIKHYNKIVFGCPILEKETLEEREFESFFREFSKHLRGKKVALFGSSGWGGREWMFAWEDRIKNLDAILFDKGMFIMGKPDNTGKYWCTEFGKAFAEF